MSWLKKNKWQIGFLVGLVLVCYLNVLQAEFVADDVYGIVNNPEIFKFDWVFKNPFIVLGRLEYFIVSNLFGLSPLMFRLSNLLAHMGVSILVYRLVSKLGNRRVGLMTGVLTAVHPVMIESVTWISGGGYVKYSFWLLLALILYIEAGKKRKWLVWSGLAYLFALQYSEKAVVLPAILIMYRLVFARKRRQWWDLSSFIVLSGTWIVSNLMQVGNRLSYLQTAYSATGEGRGLNPLVQVPVAISEYLGLVLWPDKLSLYHSEMVFSKSAFMVRVVVVGGLVLVGLWGLFKHYKGNKAWGRVSFWLGWLIVALSPTLTPLGVSWIVAERYAYLGVIGILTLMAMGIEWISQKEGRKEGVMIGFGLLVSMLMVRTMVRNSNWQTADKLWLSAKRISPNSPQNNNNLGDYYGRMGDFVQAEKHFLRAIEVNPNYAEAMHNLGNVYLQTSRFDKARESFNRALKIKPQLWQSTEQLKKLDEYSKKVESQ